MAVFTLLAVSTVAVRAVAYAVLLLVLGASVLGKGLGGLL